MFMLEYIPYEYVIFPNHNWFHGCYQSSCNIRTMSNKQWLVQDLSTGAPPVPTDFDATLQDNFGIEIYGVSSLWRKAFNKIRCSICFHQFHPLTQKKVTSFHQFHPERLREKVSLFSCRHSFSWAKSWSIPSWSSPLDVQKITV